MSKDKLITGLQVTRQMAKARMILHHQVIPRAELFEIRKRDGKLSSELKCALKPNA